MPNIRKKVYGLILLGLLTFGFIQTTMAQPADNDKVPAETPGSKGLKRLRMWDRWILHHLEQIWF